MNIKPHNHTVPVPVLTALATEAMELSGDWDDVAAVLAISRPMLDKWLSRGQQEDATVAEEEFYRNVMAARARFTMQRLRDVAAMVKEDPSLTIKLMEIAKKKEGPGRGHPKKAPKPHEAAAGDKMVMDMLRQIQGVVADIPEEEED